MASVLLFSLTPIIVGDASLAAEGDCPPHSFVIERDRWTTPGKVWVKCECEHGFVRSTSGTFCVPKNSDDDPHRVTFLRVLEGIAAIAAILIFWSLFRLGIEAVVDFFRRIFSGNDDGADVWFLPFPVHKPPAATGDRGVGHRPAPRRPAIGKHLKRFL
jgi:hypothetical protein